MLSSGWPSSWLTLSTVSGFSEGEVDGIVNDGSMGGGRRFNLVWKHAIVPKFFVNLWDDFNCEKVVRET
jgi:hypothetical protein